MRIALVGNPNVGKSMLFSRMTGIGVIASNYPGTSVEFIEAKVRLEGVEITLYDLPGTYSLSGITEDEIVATKLLAEKEIDVVIAVADATRLEKSLVLIFQLIETGNRVAIALNFMDIARKRFHIDVEGLANTLRVPVVPISAATGEGVQKLIETVTKSPVPKSDFFVRYDRHIEDAVETLVKEVEWNNPEIPLRGAIIKLLEGNEFFKGFFSEDVRRKAEEIGAEFKKIHHEDIDVHIGRDRYGEAGRLASSIIGETKKEVSFGDRLSELTLRPVSGVLILIAVLAGLLLTIVFLGGLIETTLINAYNSAFTSSFNGLANAIGGDLGKAIAQGLNLSIQGILAIVVPYIIVFYIILGALEDSGYLPRAVVLMDGLMHKIGLHGRAIIPMIVGLGCNVPAILATRVMESRRERLILATLTVIAIPCSAQSAVIIGTVGKYSGIQFVILIYLINFSLLILLGRLLHKVMKPEPSSLAIELPDLALPRPKNVLLKTYLRSRDFFVIAFPLLLVGSIALELLMVFNILGALVSPLSPLTVLFLGLPALTIIPLFFGVLRREMTVQLLFVLVGTANLSLFFTPAQFFIFALIMATYAPCLGVLAVLRREFGWRDSAKVFAGSVALSFLLGGIAHFLLQVL
jgi:ferrous iron transport protein B